MRWSGETMEQAEQRWYKGVQRFAVLPTQMMDGSWVWLEKYWAVYEKLPNNGWRWRCALNLEDAQLPPRSPPVPPNFRSSAYVPASGRAKGKD